jgi:hypothetical protein
MVCVGGGDEGGGGGGGGGECTLYTMRTSSLLALYTTCHALCVPLASFSRVHTPACDQRHPLQD